MTRGAAALLASACLLGRPLAGPAAGPLAPLEPAAAAESPPPAAPPGARTAATADTALAATLQLLEQIREKDRKDGFEYHADVMVYSQRGDSLVLRGRPAVVTHGEARLEAGVLVYRRAEQIVEARAAGREAGDSTDAPVLRRGDEVLRGARILYDLEREQGLIVAGRIERDKGFYTGSLIRTVTPDEFHVARGSYTTCDYEHPHFDFYSPRIKVLVDDLAIARPVYLRIHERRVLWIPFFAFSLRSDRQSGVLTPSFGRRLTAYGSRQTEWELRNLGYYYAPNDYWDLTLAADLRQRTGWLARMDVAYAVRYRCDGAVDLEYESRQGTGTAQRAWRLAMNHDQEWGRDARMRASGVFQSNRTFNRDNAANLADRLNQTLRSNLSYNRRWRRSGNTLSLNASQTRNLNTGTSELVAPEISLITARKALWAPPRQAASQEPWYSSIYYNASARLRHRRYSASARTQATTPLTAALSASSQHRPLPFLQVSPHFTTTWQDPDLGRGQQRAYRADELGATASLSQTLYGLFPLSAGSLLAARHEFKPDLSLSCEATRADSGGILGLGGDAGRWRQRRRLALRFDNSFWVKMERQGQVAKARLAQVSVATGYDFDRRTRPLSDLTAEVSANAGSLLDWRLILATAFYDDADRLRLLNPRLRQVELSSTLRRGGVGAGLRPGVDAGGWAARYERTPGGAAAARSSRSATAAAPHLTVSHYFARTRYGTTVTTRSWLRCGWGCVLGTANYHGYSRPKWRLEYSANYNLHAPGEPWASTRRLTAELLSVQRDFHDWTAALQLAPSSFGRKPAFYLRAQLRDIPQLRIDYGDARL